MPAVAMGNSQQFGGARQAGVDQQNLPPIQTYQSSQDGAGMAQYRPMPDNNFDRSYQAPDQGMQSSAGQDASGWTTTGGTTITVTPGDTLSSISRRYGVPEQAILTANRLSSSRDVVAGRYLTIPAYAKGRSTAPSPSADYATLKPFPENSPQPARASVVTTPEAPVRTAGTIDGTHRVSSGDTLFSIAQRYNVNVGSLSAANNLGQSSNIQIGQKLVIPGRGGTQSAQVLAPPVRSAQIQPRETIQARPATPVQSAPKQARLRHSTSEPDAPKPVRVTPIEQVTPVAYTPPAAELREPSTQAGDGALAFRWPVRGRIISTFGDKTNGERNDGINLAVPDGTPVKAAEDGVVIYSGNELKSYGNLVLVRHSDGWVTAYAHNRSLTVRRGDQVRRGQEIAEAGATGSVSSPQLRFELRKGSTPVNPLDHLGGV
uniref:LysM peptidoglycan-binding domain-containing M23 family metallopeptidase n=1 Tax=Pararhizobium sp. IMCC3301 TaxID=3067904 RepID=UPI002741F1A9|nr:LysM peptidoglycan-binding domain-containing M23 family metallopeptidase [Pararhizobium sp. IMCC3301]